MFYLLFSIQYDRYGLPIELWLVIRAGPQCGRKAQLKMAPCSNDKNYFYGVYIKKSIYSCQYLSNKQIYINVFFICILNIYTTNLNVYFVALRNLDKTTNKQRAHFLISKITPIP